jgi:hypothetical protein
MLLEEDVAFGEKILCFLEAMFYGVVVYAW